MPAKIVSNIDDLDDLEKEKGKIKQEIMDLQVKYNEYNDQRIKLVNKIHYDEAMKQLNRVAEESTRTVEQVAADWIDDGDRGHYIQAKLYFDNKGN